MSFSVWFSPVETGLVWSLVYCLFGLKTCLRLTLWKEKKNKNISISALFAAFVFYDSVAMYVLQLNFFPIFQNKYLHFNPSDRGVD